MVGRCRPRIIVRRSCRRNRRARYHASGGTRAGCGMHMTVVLLPGLGADERLFAPQRAVLPGLIVPRWPEPRRDDSLPRFAARLADAVPKSDDLFLGGSSFGGMVALEL